MSGKQLLYIVIATFITIALWVAFDIFHSRASVKTAPQVEKLLEGVVPDFDTNAINVL